MQMNVIYTDEDIDPGATAETIVLKQRVGGYRKIGVQLVNKDSTYAVTVYIYISNYNGGSGGVGADEYDTTSTDWTLLHTITLAAGESHFYEKSVTFDAITLRAVAASASFGEKLDVQILGSDLPG